MVDLKEIFEGDKRGLGNQCFVEQVKEGIAILSYYGMGDSHEGKFTYNLETGWKFHSYYDRAWEKLSASEKQILLMSCKRLDWL